jgi:hypothetical protein
MSQDAILLVGTITGVGMAGYYAGYVQGKVETMRKHGIKPSRWFGRSNDHI